MILNNLLAGAIQHKLLNAGVIRATNVEASTAYIDAAKDEAERQDHTDRVSSYHGDFVDLASDIASADIVTLDQVICCYHDMETLASFNSWRSAVQR